MIAFDEICTLVLLLSVTVLYVALLRAAWPPSGDWRVRPKPTPPAPKRPRR